jgi:hypothetical protein
VILVERAQTNQHPSLVGQLLEINASVHALGDLFVNDHVEELLLARRPRTASELDQGAIGPVRVVSISRTPENLLLNLQMLERTGLPCRDSRELSSGNRLQAEQSHFGRRLRDDH